MKMADIENTSIASCLLRAAQVESVIDSLLSTPCPHILLSSPDYSCGVRVTMRK
jgi:hypothetical protein